jgi:hypothetical protein
MTAAIPGARMGRPSNVVLIDRLSQARDEAEEWRMEVLSAAAEMRAAGLRIEYAINAGRPDVALHVAARLQALAGSYTRPYEPEPAA